MECDAPYCDYFLESIVKGSMQSKRSTLLHGHVVREFSNRAGMFSPRASIVNTRAFLMPIPSLHLKRTLNLPINEVAKGDFIRFHSTNSVPLCVLVINILTDRISEVLRRDQPRGYIYVAKLYFELVVP